MAKDTGVTYGNLNYIREIIFQQIMSHDDVLKFIYYQTTDEDIIKLPNLTNKEKNKLIGTKIFKHRRFPSNTEKANIMLSMNYGTRSYNGTKSSLNKTSTREYVSAKFCFNIIVHDSIIETYNGSRMLAIEDCLLQIFHNQRIDTLGVSYIDRTDTMVCPEGYSGICVTMKFNDFVDANRS